MMTYVFRCPTHGVFETKQMIDSLHEALCPKCQSRTDRVYTPAGFYQDNPKPLFHKDGSYEEPPII